MTVEVTNSLLGTSALAKEKLFVSVISTDDVLRFAGSAVNRAISERSLEMVGEDCHTTGCEGLQYRSAKCFDHVRMREIHVEVDLK